MLLTNVSLLLAMALLFQIIAEDYSVKTARIASVALVLFPTAYFFYAAYPHALAFNAGPGVL